VFLDLTIPCLPNAKPATSREKSAYAASFQSLLDDIEARKGVALPERYRTTPVTYITAQSYPIQDDPESELDSNAR
jgi:hypothetical protein